MVTLFLWSPLVLVFLMAAALTLLKWNLRGFFRNTKLTVSSSPADLLACYDLELLPPPPEYWHSRQASSCRLYVVTSLAWWVFWFGCLLLNFFLSPLDIPGRKEFSVVYSWERSGSVRPHSGSVVNCCAESSLIRRVPITSLWLSLSESPYLCLYLQEFVPLLPLAIRIEGILLCCKNKPKWSVLFLFWKCWGSKPSVP